MLALKQHQPIIQPRLKTTPADRILIQRKCLAVLKTEDLERTRIELQGRVKAGPDGTLPQIIITSDLTTDTPAQAFLDSNAMGYVLTDKPLAVPARCIVIKCTDLSATPSRTFAADTRDGRSNNLFKEVRSLCDKGKDITSCPRVHKKSASSAADLSPIDERFIAKMSAEQMLAHLITRGLFFKRGAANCRHLTRDEIVFRGDLIISWAKYNDRPACTHDLYKIFSTYRYDYLPAGQAYPTFVSNLAKANKNWFKR